MILYVTKKTKERLNIPMIKELGDPFNLVAQMVYNQEKDNNLFEWGLKIFIWIKGNVYRQ